jgi:hypothetical protein
MSAALAARGGPPLLPGEVLLREGLNAVLERDDRAAFDEWLAQVPVAHDDFAEVGLARRLALRPAISWTLLRLALRVRRDAELAAAADDGSHGIRRLIEEGDRLRIEAEQELFDDVGVARFERAQRLLEDARALYGEAQAGRVLLGRARRLFLNLAYRLPDYVCWWSSGGPAAAACGPEYDELVALFDELEALSALVHGGALDDRGSLEARTSSVEALRSQVESWPTEQAAHALLNDASGFHTGWHVERLLETGLPRRPARLVLLQWLPELEARSLAGSGGAPTAAGRPPMRMMSSRDWSFLVRSADLERRLAGAAEWLLPVELQQRAALDGAYQALTGSRDHLRAAADSLAAEEAVWQSHRRFRAELYRFRRSLPARAGAVAAPRLDAQTPRAAEEKLAGVRAALHALRVGGTGELADLMAVNPGRELARSELASLLAWQSERLRRGAAVGDAPATEHLAASADRHRARAAELLAQAPEAGARAPALRVDSERVLRLIAESEQPLAIALGATTASPTKVWVLLKFDPRLLDVEGPPGLRVYQEGPLGRPRGEGVAAFEGSSGVDAGGAEDLPDDQSMSGIALAGLPETLVLGPGAPATVRFRVRRRAASDGPTRLIVRAVSEADSVRHSVEVRLPFPESVHFRVAGTPGSWREAEDGVVLQPFPNRDTDYRWQLENLTAAARSLDVQVLGLTQAKTVILPPGELAAEDAALVLSQLGDLRGLGQYQDLTLAPGGGAAIPPTASPVVPPPATPDEARRRFEQSPSLLHGAVVAIADRATRRTALRFVGVEPQRPRRYVRPQVAYNLQRQRVEITVRAVDAAFVPPGGCSVRGELVEPREEASASQLSGVLQAPAFETRLFAEVPSRPGKVVHLRLHVDDYPRAFLYRLRCDVPATTIPELVDAAEVRITAPAAGAVFRSPLAAVPLELQVDAPAGAFDAPQDFVEAGLDLDRDRVLRGEPVVRLSADRQVDVRLVSAAPGAWTLNCEVGDFRVNVPAAGVESARVNLVGRLDVRGQTAWSAPLDVVIDGSPPVIRAVQLHPGNAVGPDDKLTATVQVDDGALSGAALVELAFDVERVGDFTPTTQAVAASPASSGRWTAALPAADLPPGPYGLLIRARDHAGNVSDVRRETVRVLTPAAAAANLAQRTGPVTGRALYGEQPISGASIVLKAADGKVLAEATSDKSGAFTLSRVAPGTYTVRAEGLVRNKLRRAEAEVTVPPPPASTDAVRLQLR